MGLKHSFKVLDQLQTEDNLTRGRAIRFYCLDCSGGVAAEVRKCHLKLCPLWPFRMGAAAKAAGVEPTE
jgi:hypothetical protein